MSHCVPLVVNDWPSIRAVRKQNPSGAYIYLVWWPHLQVLKAGYTGNLRQRTARYTCRRGGNLLRAWWFDASHAAFDAEDRAHSALRIWPRAFTSGEQGAECVGGRGSGWFECHRVPTVDLPRAVSAVEVSVNG